MQELSVKHLGAFLLIQLACIFCVLVLLATEQRIVLGFQLSTDLMYGLILLVLSSSLIIISNAQHYAKWWLLSLNIIIMIIAILTLFFIFKYT